MKLHRMIFAAITIVAVAGCSPSSQEKAPEPPTRTYTNPISLPDEWGEYGLGDPFIFKFNGYYYLYVSTRDTDVGVKVWKSANLIDWKYEGLCTEDPVTKGAYAPEVRYWNGKFYMYTSPAGRGHYVLVSDSPTGPFRVVTDNFGRTIDGSTFVDDDGQWYFYYAGPKGIQATQMDDPVTVSPGSVLTGAYMGGWTEGPTVFKRSGKYYMTYTGNHVFSNGYRVDVAVSDNPLHGFEGMGNNPVLLRAEGPTVGLGHNSVVTGPDLDTPYIVYHNLEGPGIVGPLRHMNLDRIDWSGDRLSVWGPTSFPQPAPAMPDFEDHFERSEIGEAWEAAGEGGWSVQAEEGLLSDSGSKGLSYLLSSEETGTDFTAEFNWQMDNPGDPNAAVGAVFSYQDENNHGIVLFHPASNEMEAKVLHEGEVIASGKAELPDGYDFAQLHLLRVEKSGTTIRLYADEMNKINLELAEPLGGGRIGYATDHAKARFGYVAFSRFVNGSGSDVAYEPLPGWVNIGAASEQMNKGDSRRVLVNVEADGEYNLHYRIVPGPDGVKFRLKDGKEKLAELEVPAGQSGQWEIASATGVKLHAGFQNWQLEIVKGSMEISSFQVDKYTAVTSSRDDFEDRNTFGWTRYEGGWSVKEGELRALALQPAKIIQGESGWTDYTVEADLTVPEAGGQTGILLRVQNPANGAERNQNRDDFEQGYYVYLGGNGIRLAKQNYESIPLADIPYDLPEAGELFHLKVEAEGNRIRVFAGPDGKEALSYEDRSERPYLQGKIGLKSVRTFSKFDNVQLEAIPTPRS